MRNNPLVSIIIPTYSRPTNICRAIDSVLNQTYSPIEIIVVDDNGENTEFQKQTEDLLNSYIKNNQIVYHKHKQNKNGSAARNTGVKLANGVLIGLLDDDDVFHPEKIELQVRFLLDNQDNPLLKGVYCNTELIIDGRIVYRHNELSGKLFEELLLGKVEFNSSTLLVYRDTYLELDGFDERYRRNQDWEFCLRFFKKYEMAVVCPERYLITKYSTPNTDSIDPCNAINRLEFFLDNFREDIQRLDSANDIYYHHYQWLTRLLLAYGYKNKAFQYLKKMQSFHHIPLKEYVVLIKIGLKALRK